MNHSFQLTSHDAAEYAAKVVGQHDKNTTLRLLMQARAHASSDEREELDEVILALRSKHEVPKPAQVSLSWVDPESSSFGVAINL